MARAMMMTILLSIVATTMLFELALAVDHTVGAPGGGWDTATDLSTWSSSQTFTVGDNLVFTYTPSHDVVEVNKDGYDSCSSSNSISTNGVSPTTFQLSEAGTRYFICSTSGHCAQGMKVEIKTVEATSTPTTPTTPTTPPSSGSPTPPVPSTSPPPPGKTANEPPKPSSATMVQMSVVSMVGIGLLMMI